MLELSLIATWTLKKLVKRCWLGDVFLFESQPLHYLMIGWAGSNQLATLLSQCAKQILALVEAAASLSPRKYERMKDVLLFLMQLEGLDQLQEIVSLSLTLGLIT